MRNRTLIHKLDDTFLTVDVTGAGPEAKFARRAQYSSWRMLSEDFVRRGATQAEIERAEREITANGNAAIAY